MPSNDLQILALLTNRDVDILRGLMAGRSNFEIGPLCGIKERTVKRYIRDLGDKLQVLGHRDARHTRICIAVRVFGLVQRYPLVAAALDLNLSAG